MPDQLTPEDRRLLSEVSVKLTYVHEKLDELKKVLFGDNANGFLYKFAGMEPDIKAIPEIIDKLRDVAKEAGDLSEKLKPMIEKVNTHDDAIKTERLIRTLIVIGISTITAAATAILTMWTTLNTLIEQLKKGGHP